MPTRHHGRPLHTAALPQVASATNDVAGDGTTTATVLTRAILVEGCKSVAAGMNPMDLRRGINLAVDHVVAELKARAKMISTTEEIAQVWVGGRVGGGVREGGGDQCRGGPSRGFSCLGVQ